MFVSKIKTLLAKDLLLSLIFCFINFKASVTEPFC
jgi:hypothetical protein